MRLFQKLLNRLLNRDDFIDLNRINFNCPVYSIKRNWKKVTAILVLVILCLITPCTNWIIVTIPKIINKLNPLWLYQ